MFLFRKEKYQGSVLFLVVAAFAYRYLSASMDPFLNMWDEQYHALVAKNLSHNMLKPVLYEKLYFEYDYKNWGGNHIWLHKQPWFLWQMAVAIKLFGSNVIAVRMPSVIMSSLMVALIYRTGTLISNKKTGWYAAFLCAICFNQVDFVSGHMATDHNDIAFMFYVSCSFWAFFEYIHAESKTRWIILIGLFSGIAILNKWLTGLAIFLGWFLYLVSDKQVATKFSSWRDAAFSFFVALIVMLPWQFYIFHQFPEEATYEFEFASRHFSEVMENHGGSNWFHIDAIPFVYGKLAPFFIIPGILALRKNASGKNFFLCMSLLVLVYIFYTLAQTKMMYFTLCLSSLVFILFGSFLNTCFTNVDSSFPKYNKYIWFISMIIIGGIYMNTDELERRHSVRFDKVQYERHIAGAEACRRAGESLKDGEYAVFNADPNMLPEFCFHSGLTGHAFIPSEEQCKNLKSKGIKIAVFDMQWMPEFIRNDKEIVILPKNFFWIYE